MTILNRVSGFTFYVDNNEFVQIGICETSQKDENSEVKINFFTLSSKESDFKFLDQNRLFKIHDLLKGFGSYKEVIGGQNKSIMGLKSIYIDSDIWDNIKTLLEKDQD